MVLAVSAKSFWDGTPLGGKKGKDQSGSPDQGVFCPIMHACSLVYVCKSDVSFLKGKNVKRYAFHKTGFIIYLDLLRLDTHVTVCRRLDVSTL